MAGIYREPHPERSVLYRAFFYYFGRFFREYDNRFEKEYGYFRPMIQDVVEKILFGHHTGFNGHNKVRAKSKREAEKVGKYIIHSLISLKRLLFGETRSKICRQRLRRGLQEESMDYLGLIATVTSPISDKGQVMVRYYGLYSNAHRRKICKSTSALSSPPIIEDKQDYVIIQGWAVVRLSRVTLKVYEVDPLLCFTYNAWMRIIAFLEEH